MKPNTGPQNDINTVSSPPWGTWIETNPGTYMTYEGVVVPPVGDVD